MPRFPQSVTALAAMLSIWAAVPGLAAEDPAGQAGPYLAAHMAGAASDYAAAADWFARVSAADPNNQILRQQAAFSQILAGRTADAVPLVEGLDPKNSIAALTMLAADAGADRYQAILDGLDGGRRTGPLLDGLARAWALFGLGQVNEAAAAFDALAAQPPLRPLAMYHKGLALALVGDFEGALAALDDPATEPLRPTRRFIHVRAQVLSQLERDPEAVALLDQSFGGYATPGYARLRDRLKAGETVPFDLVKGARDGLAEAFYSIALITTNQGDDGQTLAYARLATWLRPDHVDATLLVAALLEKAGQNDLAAEAYRSVSIDDPSFYAAELGRADAVAAAGRPDAAIEILEQLAKGAPAIPDAWIRLGDMLRRAERYGDAIAAYDRAVATLGKTEAEHWGVYYARGICRERARDWPGAEADFTKALALNPDQPDVLNYMGYSLLERKERLDEALGMIERAAKADPDSGAITDSLGWGLFRLGRYQEAVGHMEHAVELMPVDPVINDHLGDVYWAVGRKREAEFQWKRALSFKPETEDEAARIRRKLEVGLDALLKEEGAPPLATDRNDG